MGRKMWGEVNPADMVKWKHKGELCYGKRRLGVLPYLQQQNPDKNPSRHGGEKPACFLPEV